MATYAAVLGVMSAIETLLQEQLPTDPTTHAPIGKVQLFGSADFKQSSIPNTLALYLYRISIDPTIPGGYVRALPGAPGGRIAEVPLMLHFLMISIADTAANEIALMSWGFQQLAARPIIGADRMAAQAVAWDASDDVQVATEELTREELMRIWDTLPLKYSLTVPYVARGVRVALIPDMLQGPPVTDRSITAGRFL